MSEVITDSGALTPSLLVTMAHALLVRAWIGRDLPRQAMTLRPRVAQLRCYTAEQADELLRGVQREILELDLPIVAWRDCDAAGPHWFVEFAWGEALEASRYPGGCLHCGEDEPRTDNGGCGRASCDAILASGCDA